MSNWKTVNLCDICEINMGQSPKSEYYNTNCEGLPFLQGNRTFGAKYPTFDIYTNFSTKTAEVGDVIMSVRAPVGDVNITPIKMCLGRGICGLRHKDGEQEFLYYLMRYYSKDLIKRESGTVFGSINRNDIATLNVSIPPLIEQIEIGQILRVLDDRITINEKINHHLEQIAQAIFKSWFVDFEPWDGKQPVNWHVAILGDLVQIIDNRGKTPPFAPMPTDYPIIDVKALSGSQRVVDFKNCTKFVEAEIYHSWFRSGHPQSYDILLSTVGSLAEMKLFLGNRGCIAQNVVCFRSKMPLYLFQYLQYIKNDLVSYNIGSVQPSIKVTHITKHPILVPTDEILQQFNEAMQSITEEIYTNHCQSEHLATLRDTLLTRLMSGELSVSDIVGGK